MFLQASDLYLSMLQDELDEITRSDTALVTAALDAAEEEMKLYLYDSYDTETIFAQTSTARHSLLVQFGADIAIYFIVARCQAGQEIDDRKARYDRAIQLLKQFQKSETYSNLPRRTATKQNTITYGSNAPRNNHF